MKKIIAVIIAMFMLCSCSSMVSQSEHDAVIKERDELRAQVEQFGGKTIPSQSGSVWKPGDEESNSSVDNNQNLGFDVESIVSQLETVEYTWKSYNYYYVALVVKNNSSSDIDLTAAINFLDADKKIIGTADGTNHAVAVNSETLFIFSNETAFTSYEYELTPSQIDYYQCVTQNITYETNIVDEKLIVTAMNNGEVAIEFVRCTALFMQGQNVVVSDNNFCVDSDNELKAGKSKSTELRCREPFDNVKVFFDGRASK